MRKKRNHRAKHSLENWLHWLKKSWESMIKSLKAFFSGNAGGRRSRRSHRNQELNEQTHLSSEPIKSNSPSVSFLLGLEDIDNLEFLTTKELIEQIEWNAESQEVLTVKEEDLNLLEDLLVSFPES